MTRITRTKAQSDTVLLSPTRIPSRLNLIYHRYSPSWKLWLESQQDHPWFVADVVSLLHLTTFPLRMHELRISRVARLGAGRRGRYSPHQVRVSIDCFGCARDHFTEMFGTGTDSRTESTPLTLPTHTPMAYQRLSSGRLSSSSTLLERRLSY